ncbi:V-type H-ATPase subunit C [Fragilariopsis cylindrus CCMP1102]|uniref:V-type proton ATPase subunit C n=1 Tax=Fragilariopsis cylindrus CCMP1102 TaxID=635003 RepID=A0A1E7FRF3_9STRA|nr:V-type H-ATPase subunit C [Fragilariopsis cylindrus CCMP1102]|eukprot:OEU20750.1 V-type H-ATPase subunit C [Fragilariopsis cylindrus CCMP1102]
MSYCIVAISNDGGAPEQAYRKMQSAGACPEAPYAEMFKFEVPSLTVGTLDTLMTLSDDLVKTDGVVEQTVRKIERTTAELFDRKSSDLTVGGVPAQRYIQQFAWDSAKYPNRRPLKELVAMIAGGAAGIEEELKQLTTSFADKQAALQDAKRKSGGNLMKADLNDSLDAATMSNVNIVDTEYLKTVFVAIPKQAKENFESTIESLVDRHKVCGSPVVPGSAQLVKSDDDSLLYAVTILKGEYEAELAKACREKRFVLREFKWDPSQAAKSAMAREQLYVEVDGMKSALMRWCKTHFGDAFVAWMHIKAIRVFVESVLRYGLPVDFTSVLYKIHNGKDYQLTQKLDKSLGSGADDDIDEGAEEYHDFVLLKFEP